MCGYDARCGPTPSWVERNATYEDEITEALQKVGIVAELAVSNRITHWAYAQTEAAGLTWLQGDPLLGLATFGDSGRFCLSCSNSLWEGFGPCCVSVLNEFHLKQERDFRLSVFRRKAKWTPTPSITSVVVSAPRFHANARARCDRARLSSQPDRRAWRISQVQVATPASLASPDHHTCPLTSCSSFSSEQSPMEVHHPRREDFPCPREPRSG